MESETTSTKPVEATAALVDSSGEPPLKKAKLEQSAKSDTPGRIKGIAQVKAEYLIASAPRRQADDENPDNLAEAEGQGEGEANGKKKKKDNKNKGQNTARKFARSKDAKGLCGTRALRPEFSPDECHFGEKCKFEHDLRLYLKEHKRDDLTTLGGLCPVWDAKGQCFAGWKCRFVGSHMAERETDDGRKELVLVEDEDRKRKARPLVAHATEEGIANNVPIEVKSALSKKKVPMPRSDAILTWLNKTSKELENSIHGRAMDDVDLTPEDRLNLDRERVEENRAQFTEPPFLPSEKRRIYFGPETPALAPLTTQGNLPFRRLCTELGAQFTYSEMAMSMPLLNGSKSEWALLRAHESEMTPPTVNSSRDDIVQGYDNSKDLKFGAQIAANKPFQALKVTEALSAYCPSLRVIDLNCGCPIDLVYREGAGSALLDHASKLEKILRGMNSVSKEIPITVKIRMGTKDNSPNAQKLVERFILGGYEANVLQAGPPGVAAITLHGRSRQQRYTRQADWEYISETAALIKRLNEKANTVADTIREPDERYLPNGGRVYFLGNGDCYSHEEYNDHIQHAGVDTVMLARGALIKPWLFEEIQAGQYLDKSASERLTLVEKFTKYGLETWGSDEHGIGTTRRFLLEWLNFTHRYVPVGLLEYLPPNLNDRPPAWRGRNELETLMASDNYKDWIKITEMFLGPVQEGFKFEPKHKSNSYEAEG
ncbi:hypothetical protein ASPZODRAFT_98315 [Penicilliopsis zonata CBS 506.65]|uniref:tRNA-dihydrouridine(47) synthase [NAD(P)(+)] n=1 Tax=Penicilliopsis zonata CBS 506.65 TaxID=1073090 RepID=A0A1L9SEG0_9EURO|nr:hypothetical protein ASPZODRAFT_98315 [Penicilliopsis zonata CBS 506.65]OJJ45610.1 hypothetical protein ASPZODRAFT_98315 [Penicilliopsis zonata CBS 506.65]